MDTNTTLDTLRRKGATPLPFMISSPPCAVRDGITPGLLQDLWQIAVCYGTPYAHALIFQYEYELREERTIAVDLTGGLSLWVCRSSIYHAGVTECCRPIELSGSIVLYWEDQFAPDDVRKAIEHIDRHATGSGKQHRNRAMRPWDN